MNVHQWGVFQQTDFAFVFLLLFPSHAAATRITFVIMLRPNKSHVSPFCSQYSLKHASLLFFHMKRIITPYLPVRFFCVLTEPRSPQSFRPHATIQQALIFQLCRTSFNTVSVLLFHMKGPKPLIEGVLTLFHYCLCLFSICLQFVWLWQPLPLSSLSLHLFITLVIQGLSVQHMYQSASKCSLSLTPIKTPVLLLTEQDSNR